MDREHIVYLSVGSNMGDKRRSCSDGLAALDRPDASRLLAVSPYYCTEPVDYTDQDWFVNAVAKIATRHEPPELLAELQRIQRQAGRRGDAVRFGPRILDLDILLFDDLVMESPELVIPHPRMHKRHFVLKPFCDIEPHIIHPVLGRSIRSILDGLDTAAQRIRPYPCE